MRFSLRTLIFVMLLGGPVLSAEPEWTLVFRYGAGSPNDAGPMGHCTATISSTGRITVESKGRKGRNGPADVIVFKNESVPPQTIQALYDAAESALRESPFKRRGELSDGCFLRLERSGPVPGKTSHANFRQFNEAPTKMKKFVRFFNTFLPPEDQIPLSDD